MDFQTDNALCILPQLHILERGNDRRRFFPILLTKSIKEQFQLRREIGCIRFEELTQATTNFLADCTAMHAVNLNVPRGELLHERVQSLDLESIAQDQAENRKCVSLK